MACGSSWTGDRTRATPGTVPGPQPAVLSGRAWPQSCTTWESFADAVLSRMAGLWPSQSVGDTLPAASAHFVSLCHTLVILTLFPHPLRGQMSLINPVCSEGSNDSCSLFFLKFIFHDSGFTVFCPPLRNSSDLSLSLCSVLKFTQVYWLFLIPLWRPDA